MEVNFELYIDIYTEIRFLKNDIRFAKYNDAMNVALSHFALYYKIK